MTPQAAAAGWYYPANQVQLRIQHSELHPTRVFGKQQQQHLRSKHLSPSPNLRYLQRCGNPLPPKQQMTNNSFTISAPSGTDIWRKPPTTDVYTGMFLLILLLPSSPRHYYPFTYQTPPPSTPKSPPCPSPLHLHGHPPSPPHLPLRPPLLPSPPGRAVRPGRHPPILPRPPRRHPPFFGAVPAQVDQDGRRVLRRHPPGRHRRLRRLGRLEPGAGLFCFFFWRRQ